MGFFQPHWASLPSSSVVFHRVVSLHSPEQLRCPLLVDHALAHQSGADDRQALEQLCRYITGPRSATAPDSFGVRTTSLPEVSGPPLLEPWCAGPLIYNFGQAARAGRAARARVTNAARSARLARSARSARSARGERRALPPRAAGLGQAAQARVGSDTQAGSIRVLSQPVVRNSREGRAGDARRIAEQHDKALVWPDFINDGDNARVW